MNETPANFESAMNELEGLVAKLEGGDLALNDSLIAYQRGHSLLAYCQSQLQSARQQIQLLDGQTLKPFEPDSND